MAKRLVVVIGSPGAGKSSVIDSMQGSGYKLINLGDVMLDIAMKKKLAKNRDKMRYLDSETQAEIRDLAIKRIAKLDGKVVLGTHATVEQHGRFFPGLSHYVITHLGHINGLFYIDATTSDIMSRRKKDKNRKRELESAWTIDTQRSINLAIASYLSSDLNIPLYIIHNKEGQLNKTIRVFRSQLKDAFGEK